MAPSRVLVGILIDAIDKLDETIQSREAVSRADTAGVVARLATLLPQHRDGSAANRENSGRNRPRILLVEDDFASRLLLQTFLPRYGGMSGGC